MAFAQCIQHHTIFAVGSDVAASPFYPFVPSQERAAEHCSMHDGYADPPGVVNAAISDISKVDGLCSLAHGRDQADEVIRQRSSALSAHCLGTLAIDRVDGIHTTASGSCRLRVGQLRGHSHCVSTHRLPPRNRKVTVGQTLSKTEVIV